MDEKIAYQDRGTGLDPDEHRGGWAAAGDVAAGIAAAGGPVVVEGFGIPEASVDTGAGEATVEAGQAVLVDSGVSDGRTDMEWLRGAFPVRHPGGTVNLATAGATNVWLDGDPQAAAPNQVELVTGSTPSEPRLLLGTIDESGTVTLQGRRRSEAFDRVEAEEFALGDDGPARSFAGIAAAAADVEGLTNPLNQPFDANGNPIENVGPLSAESADVDAADVGSLRAGRAEITGVLEGPSVATVADLPDPSELSAGASVYVESENRYYKVQA